MIALYLHRTTLRTLRWVWPVKTTTKVKVQLFRRSRCEEIAVRVMLVSSTTPGVSAVSSVVCDGLSCVCESFMSAWAQVRV